MQISKQELKQIIREEIEKETLKELELADIERGLSAAGGSIEKYIRDLFKPEKERSEVGDTTKAKKPLEKKEVPKGAYDAVVEWFISAIAGKIIASFNLSPDSVIALAVRKGVANIDRNELATIVTNEDGARCRTLTENFMEGAIEAVAQRLFDLFRENFSKDPAFAATFGVSTEAITNWIATFLKTQKGVKIEKQVEKIICRGTSEAIKKYLPFAG